MQALSMWCYCIIVLATLINCGSLQLTATESSSSDTLLRLELSEEDNLSNENYFKVNLNNETKLRGVRLPCQCAEGECGCCSGNILQNFNIHIRQHFCVNMTYEREDASLGVKMSFNDLVLVSSRVSGRFAFSLRWCACRSNSPSESTCQVKSKNDLNRRPHRSRVYRRKNPPPICIPIPRIANIKFCGRFSNVYFIGRNIHACVSVETEWNNRTVFSYSFDCVRLGVNGVAIIPPEAGGGLPHPPEQEIDQIEEYDELLENQTTKRPNRKSTKHPAQGSTIKRTTKKP